jgi:uncharacterized membrane protein/protein-disulfide isomerase
MHDPIDDVQEPPPTLLWLARGLAAAAAGLSGYLLWVAWAKAKAAGCGDAGIDCDSVLNSRWSQWLGLPVSLAAVVVYASAFLTLLAIGPNSSTRTCRDAWFTLLPLGALLGGAALWFLALQALVIHRYCPYCLAVHACGILLSAFILRYCPVRWRGKAPRQTLPIPGQTAWLLLFLGLGGALVVVGGQVLTPSHKADGMQVIENRPPPLPASRDAGQPAVKTEVPKSTDGAAPKTDPPRRLTILDGKYELELLDHPCLGSRQAPTVVAVMFDYTCSHCRTLDRYLEQCRKRYGGQLAVILLPMPLNPNCNKHFKTEKPQHVNACEYARLALAVWKTEPAEFAGFHQWLMGGKELPSLQEATDRAKELLGAGALEKALLDEDLAHRVEKNVKVYALADTGVIPKLFTEKWTTIGEPESAGRLFEFFEKNLGLKSPQK